ncbi:MAG: VOC family protein [Chloroflexi bacterium]|nr:VOC family protein [Chloroflexota bacterium]
MLKIGHIELFVKNTAASQKFFQDVLGFELVADQGAFIWLKCGAVEILLRPGKGNLSVDQYQDAASAIVLYADDLAKTANDFEARGLSFNGTDGSDGCLTFTDPDGHWFQLVNPEHA